MAEKWSRDWENFNWEEVEEKLQCNMSMGEKTDIGINADELKEYVRWLSFYHPDACMKLQFFLLFCEKGLSFEQAEFLASNPDLLMDAIKIVLGKDFREGEDGE